MNYAYFLTPILAFPLFLIWRSAIKRSSNILLMIAFQFTAIAFFEILFDCLYVLVLQDSLTDNILSEQYLFDSFLATAIQYNVFIISLLWLFQKRNVSNCAEWLDKNDIKYLFIAVMVGGGLSFYQFYQTNGITLTYGNVSSDGTIESVAGSWGPIGFFVNLGTMYAVVFLCLKREGTHPWTITYAISLFLVLMFGLKILTGARAVFFTLTLYFMSALFLIKKHVIKYIIPLMVVSFLFVMLFSSFSSLRITGAQMNTKDAISLFYKGIADEINSSEVSEMYSRSIRNFAWRCAGARMGAVLFADVEVQGTVGVASVVDNMFSVIPRAFWRSRPFGNSRDGTADGMAGYQVSEILNGRLSVYGHSDSVSTAAVAYWTLGWIGVVMSGLISAFLLWFISTGALTKSVNPALLLFGLTGGGWMIIADVGTWLNNFPRFCLYLFIIVACRRLCTHARWL